MNPPQANIVHEVDGRLRVRVPARRGNTRYFEAAAEAFRACEGVSAIVANPVSASILLVHATSRRAIEAFALERGIFTLHHERLPDVASERMASALDSVASTFDRAITQATRNTGDLRSILFLVLAGAAAVQAVRGRALPAGVTLVKYALQALPGRER